MRRSGRIPKEVPIHLIGSDLDGRVFSESTKTVVLSLHGAGIVSTHKLSPEQELVLRLPDRNKEAEVRVVGEIGSHEGVHTYGVAFLDLDLSFWGIPLPPVTPAEIEAGLLSLVCVSCKTLEKVDDTGIEADVCATNEGVIRYCKRCGLSTLWKPALKLMKQETVPPPTEQLPIFEQPPAPAAEASASPIAPAPPAAAPTPPPSPKTLTPPATPPPSRVSPAPATWYSPEPVQVLRTFGESAPRSSSAAASSAPPASPQSPSSSSGPASSVRASSSSQPAAQAEPRSNVLTLPSPEKPSPPVTNRRKHPRVKVNYSACIRHPERGEEIVTCEDMSRGGLRFKSRKRYYERSIIDVAVPYQHGQAAIFVPAQIVFVQELPEQQLFRCGVAYLKSIQQRDHF